MSDEQRRELLQTIVPALLTFASFVGLVVSLSRDYVVGASMLLVLVIVFGLVASGARILTVRVGDMHVTAETPPRIRVQADYELAEPVSPQPLQGQDAA